MSRFDSEPREHWNPRFEQFREALPDLTREQFAALGLWFQIKAAHESRWTEEQRQCLRQLDPDVWHSALLWRMLGERKPPLAAPPSLSHSYPVYPDEPLIERSIRFTSDAHAWATGLICGALIAEGLEVTPVTDAQNYVPEIHVRIGKRTFRLLIEEMQ